MTNALLETGQHRLLVAGIDIDHPVRAQTDLGQGRREQVLPGDAPQDLAPGPGGDAGREQRCGRPVDRGIAAAGHLVQRPERHPSPREPVVYGPDPERQDGAGALRQSLKLLNLLAKATDCQWLYGDTHGLLNALKDGLFLLCPLTSQ